jgi:hypothetical protein
MSTIERLRALLAEATPGPWRHGPLFWEAWATDADGAMTVRVAEVPHGGYDPESDRMRGVFVDPGIDRSREPDAALIAAAVNALPALLDVAEAARLVAQWADNAAEWSVPPPLRGELRDLSALLDRLDGAS